MTSFLLLMLLFCGCRNADRKELRSYEKAGKKISFLSGGEVPDEFKHYQSLNANVQSSAYKFELLIRSENYWAPNPIRLFYGVGDDIIVEVNREGKEKEPGYHYYKLDKSGAITDSLYHPLRGGLRSGFVGAYVVYLSSDEEYYYNTWPLNGDKTKKRIKILNQDLSWTTEKLEKTDHEISLDAKHIFYEAENQTGENGIPWSLNKVFFFKNGRWQVLYRRQSSAARIDNINKLRALRYDFFRTSNDTQTEEEENFELKFFEKTEWLNYDHAIGGGQAGFSTAGWSGTAYFNLPLNQDSLKIKVSDLIIEQEKADVGMIRYYRSHGSGEIVSPFNLNYYTSRNLNYAMYSNDANHLYLIKKRKL